MDMNGLVDKKTVVSVVVAIVVAVFVLMLIRWVLSLLGIKMERFADYPFMNRYPWDQTSAVPGEFIGDQVAFGSVGSYTNNDGNYQFMQHGGPADQTSANMARYVSQLDAKEGMCGSGKCGFSPSFKDGNQFSSCMGRGDIKKLDEPSLVSALHGGSAN